MDLEIRWKDNSGTWQPFPLGDINHMSRDHVIGLLSHKVPVMAKQDGKYMTNSEQLREQLQNSKKQAVKLFSELHPSTGRLADVGLI